jgi:hypothetical protein
MCKCGNVFSLPVLIGREAWPQNNSHNLFEHFYVLAFKLLFHRKPNVFSVAIAKRKHPFPFRTRKLSSFAPMVLLGKLSGRVGRRRKSLYSPESSSDGSGFFFRGREVYRTGTIPCSLLRCYLSVNVPDWSSSFLCPGRPKTSELR